MEGLLPTLGLSLFLVAASPLLASSTAEDRLVAGRRLSVNQTIVSPGGNYALGFFSPGRSADRRYVGIWCNNILAWRVVWVANREKPVVDSSGVFTVAGDGNLVVLDGKGGLLWSSSVSAVHGNATAVLLDTGNLVLSGGQGDVVFWQSFDHPGNTVLPEMKMRLDIRTGAATRLVSWRGAEDPSPGNFSFGLDPDTPLQIKTWRGSETWTRWRLWSGNQIDAERLNISDTTTMSVSMVEVSEEQINMSFTVTQGSTMLLGVLDPGGMLKVLLWQQSSMKWSPLGWNPRSPCDYYNRCGPSGLCNSNGTSLECSCLKAFVPKDQKAWDQGDYSAGCIRREPLKCDQEEKFLRLGMIGIPDRFMLMRNVDAAKCEAECLRRCNCTAYCYSDVPSAGSSTSCLVWAGELLDLRKDPRVVYELNVRLVASELEDGLQTSGSKTHLLEIAFATSGAMLLLLGISSFFLRGKFRREEKGKKKDSNSFDDIKFHGTLPNGEHVETPLLHLSTVLAATENFSPANKLGEGGFGPVYKGGFNDGQEIAVKRLSKRSTQGLEEFKTEILLLARLQHRNLVRLLGCCIKGEERMLIYEYLPNKSLDFFLFDTERAVQLDWTRRYHIIEGIAQGLLYLHKHSRLRIIHRDLKASNILLDNEMTPKISDFGMARIFGTNESEANTNRVVGTYGYMSPEYAMKGIFSVKSDVFSFGVVLLEIITGKRNTRAYQFSGSLNLPGHAWKMWKEGREMDLVDPSIRHSCPEEEVSRCIHVALMCTQDDATDRPATSNIVAMLGNENASPPVPKQPAFLIGSNMAEGDSNPLPCSINLVTMSATDGR